jgi:hypothetical protein
MIYRIAAVLVLASTVLLAGFLFWPGGRRSAERASRNGALFPEVELSEPVPAPIMIDHPGDARPIALADAPEPVPAPLAREAMDTKAVVLPAQRIVSNAQRLELGRIDEPPAAPVESR